MRFIFTPLRKVKNSCMFLDDDYSNLKLLQFELIIPLGMKYIDEMIGNTIQRQNLPLKFLSVILKLSGQKALDETILAPSFILAKRSFNCNEREITMNLQSK